MHSAEDVAMVDLSNTSDNRHICILYPVHHSMYFCICRRRSDECFVALRFRLGSRSIFWRGPRAIGILLDDFTIISPSQGLQANCLRQADIITRLHHFPNSHIFGSESIQVDSPLRSLEDQTPRPFDASSITLSDLHELAANREISQRLKSDFHEAVAERLTSVVI
jgi:hypothetical protein